MLEIKRFLQCSMLDVTHLRIGNYISYMGKPYKIETISLDNDDEAVPYVNLMDNKSEVLSTSPYYHQIDPVPITPEMLYKCGFKFDAKYKWLAPECYNKLEK